MPLCVFFFFFFFNDTATTEIYTLSLHAALPILTGTVLRSDGLDALWATLAHADLGSVTADQHHPEVHTHAHTHGSHSGIGTDDHHAQLHEAAHRSAGGDPLSVLNLAGFP